ncbi:NAD(P)-dependent oxidoreductase [Schleiferiaceae bacterium]|nr:NAD(P)-dependent oxidoreductase [Schleiferiaceae bacterium]
MKRTILLIGGAGYVGTVLTDHFLSQGFSVRVIDNFTYENQFAVASFIGNSNYSIHYGDMTIEDELDRVCDESLDYVVLLAGLVGDPITKKYPDLHQKVNVDGIKKVIDYFDDKSIQKLLFISTCSNYGLIETGELADENFDLKPLSLYAEAKVDAEKYILSKKNKVAYSATILRFATAFGLSPRMRFDLTVSEFARTLYFNKTLKVFDENTWRPYCHVRDFARLINIVLDAERRKVDFEVFNAGGEGNNFTKQMIVDAILSQIPQGRVEYSGSGSDPRNYKVSFKKVFDRLGFTPAYSVEDGIIELIKALKMGLYSDNLDDLGFGNYIIKK